MEYYSENLDALKQYDEKAYNKYVEWVDEKNDSAIEVEEEVARDGNRILNVIKEGKKYRLNSRYYPEKEAKQWSEQFQVNNLNQVVNLFGLGNLMFPISLKQAGREDMKLVIYEPSIEIFDFLMKTRPMEQLLLQKNTVILIKGLNDNALYGILDFLLSWENLSDSLVACCPQYDKIFKEEYEEYCQEIKEGKIRTKIRNNTAAYFGKDVVYNTITSMTFFRDAQFLKQYVGKFNEIIPAIIVSAGPSLDLNIEKLKKAKGRSVIIATDTAMRDLIKHNVMPDFIVTVDPRKPAEYLQDEKCQDIPLFCLDSANRKILQNHRGQKIFAEVSPFLEALCPSGIWEGMKLGKGGSVATAAFSICVALKFKTIILVGQDLAYRNGISHAGNRMSGEKAHGNWLVEVEDIYGNKIKTRHEWYAFLQWFEDAIELLKEKIQVIDATEGGAKIHGTKVMALDEAINQYCIGEINCELLLKEIGKFYTEEEYKEVLRSVEKAIKDNRKSIEETKKLIADIERLLSLCKRKEFGKEYKRITQDLLKKGENIMKRPVYRVAETWSADVVFEGLSSINHLGDDLEDEEMKTYLTALEFYKKLHIACREIEPILQKAYETMIIKED